MPFPENLDSKTEDPLAHNLTPTVISQFVALSNCQRYLWFNLHRSQTARLSQTLQKEFLGIKTKFPEEDFSSVTAITSPN